MVGLQTFGWNLESKISLYVKRSHFFTRYQIKKHLRRGKFGIVIMDVGVECYRGEESIMWELELVQQFQSLIGDFTELGELDSWSGDWSVGGGIGEVLLQDARKVVGYRGGYYYGGIDCGWLPLEESRSV